MEKDLRALRPALNVSGALNSFNAKFGKSFKKTIIQITYSKPQQLPTLYFIRS